MYVCICNGVTDQQIREAVASGCANVAELTLRTGCGANCGSCIDMAATLIEQSLAVRELPLPLIGLVGAA